MCFRLEEEVHFTKTWLLCHVLQKHDSLRRCYALTSMANTFYFIKDFVDCSLLLQTLAYVKKLNYRGAWVVELSGKFRLSILAWEWLSGRKEGEVPANSRIERTTCSLSLSEDFKPTLACSPYCAIWKIILAVWKGGGRNGSSVYEYLRELKACLGNYLESSRRWCVRYKPVLSLRRCYALLLSCNEGCTVWMLWDRAEAMLVCKY